MPNKTLLRDLYIEQVKESRSETFLKPLGSISFRRSSLLYPVEFKNPQASQRDRGAPQSG